MDDEHLKNGSTVLTKDYFEEQLQSIRKIRLSERRFYQKITDFYATSIDYDSKVDLTRQFFDRIQNQLHWALDVMLEDVGAVVTVMGQDLSPALPNKVFLKIVSKR